MTAGYDEYETAPADYEAGRPGLTARQVRDMLGLLLVTLGLVGLVVIGWSVDWRLGASLACVVVATVGILIGRE